jgi:hypothetical protein
LSNGKINIEGYFLGSWMLMTHLVCDFLIQ